MNCRIDGIIIKKADASMAKELSAIDYGTFSEPWSEKSFAEAIGSDTYSFFAAINLSDGKIAGYAGMYSVLDTADITEIAVLPEYRRRGTASLLICSLFDEAKKRNVTEIHLEVRESNIAARSLYEKHGFTVDGIRKNFYRLPTENAVLMTKRL